jgi:hypothetical protein
MKTRHVFKRKSYLRRCNLKIKLNSLFYVLHQQLKRHNNNNNNNNMDFWRRSARKSRKEKVRNGIIRTIMEVGKNILEVIEEKRLRWFGHVKRMPGNRLPLKILEWEPEETRRRGRPKERWIDEVRRSMTNHGLTEDDTRDRQMAKLSFG